MKRKRTIIFSFIATALFSLAIIQNEQKQIQQYRSVTEDQIQPILFNSSNSEVNVRHPESSRLNRNEVLKKSLKGYREETYWGNEHPILEQTKI